MRSLVKGRPQQCSGQVPAHGKRRCLRQVRVSVSTPPVNSSVESSNGRPPASTTSPAPPASQLDSGDLAFWELLSNPEIESMERAKSASDAALLRRKGHLKEQDNLIEYMRAMHETHTCEEVMLKMERWVAESLSIASESSPANAKRKAEADGAFCNPILQEYRQDPRRSKLKRIVPTVGSFFTPLRLVDAFHEYDAVFSLSRRKYIHPNFAELRHILNIAQIHASADSLRLITFDADGTLYADGHHIEQDSVMIQLMLQLMKSGVDVGIVTAAGYPGDAKKFEARVRGLLDTFKKHKLPPSITNKFHLMGGECNYLLQVNPNNKELEFVPHEEWGTPEMLNWDEEDIKELLDEAEMLLLEGAARLNLPVTLMRKTRSVGVIPAAPTIYEVLEDLAITVQQNLISKLPFCAFNGGNDVFVDVGNKSLGLDALMRYLGCYPHEVLHVGDRFTDSGNDTATRDCCAIVWVANPEETGFFIKTLLKDIRSKKRLPYIE